jgi:hypothetical protein
MANTEVVFAIVRTDGKGPSAIFPPVIANIQTVLDMEVVLRVLAIVNRAGKALDAKKVKIKTDK